MRCAIVGLRLLVVRERNARVHLAGTVVVVGSAVVLGLSTAEWCWIVLAIAAVWAAEALNTAIELLADAVAPGQDPMIGSAKDVAAGGVLVAVMAAVVIGALVFVPHILEMMTDG